MGSSDAIESPPSEHGGKLLSASARGRCHATTQCSLPWLSYAALTAHAPSSAAHMREAAEKTRMSSAAHSSVAHTSAAETAERPQLGHVGVQCERSWSGHSVADVSTTEPSAHPAPIASAHRHVAASSRDAKLEMVCALEAVCARHADVRALARHTCAEYLRLRPSAHTAAALLIQSGARAYVHMRRARHGLLQRANGVPKASVRRGGPICADTPATAVAPTTSSSPPSMEDASRSLSYPLLPMGGVPAAEVALGGEAALEQETALEALQWAVKTTAEGRIFYFNKLSKERTWRKPQALKDTSVAGRSERTRALRGTLKQPKLSGVRPSAGLSGGLSGVPSGVGGFESVASRRGAEGGARPEQTPLDKDGYHVRPVGLERAYQNIGGGGEYRQKFVIKPEPAVVGATEVLKFAAASMPPPPPPSGRRRKTACEYLL